MTKEGFSLFVSSPCSRLTALAPPRRCRFRLFHFLLVSVRSLKSIPFFPPTLPFLFVSRLVSVTLHRNSSLAVWCHPLFAIRSRPELAVRRSENSGRPCTRAQAGFIRRRWADSLSVAAECLSQHHFSLDHLFSRSIVDDGTPANFDSLLKHF